jgi:5-methylcytosine-specific restriction endonuclease McrA
MEQSKTCRACGETKPATDFATKGKGRAARCKPCLAEWAANYRATSSDRINANARAAYTADPTKKRASKDAYYRRHHGRIRAACRARFAEQYPVDPAPWRAAKSRRKSRTGQASPEDRQIAVDYRRAIATDPCFYCRRTDLDERHIEHFFPLALGGAEHWTNLVMSCGDCNRRKHLRCGTWARLRFAPVPISEAA